MDTEQIVQQNERAVLVIFGEKTDSGAPTQSSGCFVHPEGFILATAHQVTDVKALRGKSVDGTEYTLDIVEVDEAGEIALLKADKPPVQVARIGDASKLRSGSKLVSIAAPEGLEFSTIDGTVANANRTYRGFPVIQVNLPASPGSSGGPVFNSDGKLVAIIIGKVKFNDGEAVSIANPVNNAYAILQRHLRPVEPVLDADAIIPAKGISKLESQALNAYNRGVAATFLQDKIADYGTAVKLVPAFFEAWFNLAVAYTAARQTSQAVDAYRTAQQLRPGNVAVARNLGRVLLKSQRFDKAVTCFQKAAEAFPNDASLHNDLGEAYRQMQKFYKAEKAFLEALRIKPNYPAARYNLALTYAAVDEAEKAVENLEAYLKLVPNASDAEQVKIWIEKLKKENQ